MQRLFLAILMVTTAHGASSQSLSAIVVPIKDALPATARIEAIQSAMGTSRMYYVVSTDGQSEVWMYDRTSKASSRIVRGDLSGLTIADNGTALAFSKTSEDGKSDQVWSMPLDPRTGLSTAPERRVSTVDGDVPAISPDGKWIAFARDDSVGQSLVVVPLSGGPVRILATPGRAGISIIRWTPDNKTLFYGVNPRNTSSGLRTIERVSVSGGSPTRIVETADAWPLLSPDGTRLVYRDTASVRSYVVADPTGRRLSTWTLPLGVRIQGWSGSATLLTTSGGIYKSLRAYSIADGRSRILLDSMDRLRTPAWSENGQQVSAIARSAPSAISVLNADGSGRREYPLREAGLWGGVWSPDGRWIAFRGQSGPGQTVSVLEVVTGRVRALAYPDFPGQGYLAWSADSKRVRYLDSNAGSRDATGTRRVPLTEVGLDGVKHVIKEVAFNGTRVWLSTVQDSLVVIKRDAGEAVTITQLRGGGNETQLIPPNSGYVSIPILSADQKWIAFKRSASLESPVRITMVDVVRSDGRSRKSINLPFVAVEGEGNPQFLPGNRDVIVAEEPALSKDFVLYKLSIASGETKPLLTITRDNERRPAWSLSPDGRTVLYVATTHHPVTVGTIDLTKLSAK